MPDLFDVAVLIAVVGIPMLILLVHRRDGD
jgi:hypothetical protein